MRTSSVIAILVFGAAFCAPKSVQAEINRCQSRDGTPVFTDQSCDLLGQTYKLSAAYQPGTDVRRPGRALSGRLMPKFGIGCAAQSPEGMRSAVRLAIESGDPNQLSALIDWNGTRRKAAMGVMSRLQHLVSRPAVAIELGGESYEYSALTSPMTTVSRGDGSSYGSVGTIDAARTYTVRPTGLPTLHVLRAHGDEPSMEHARFQIVRDAGCLWLRP
jgi:hypothetical protein